MKKRISLLAILAAAVVTSACGIKDPAAQSTAAQSTAEQTQAAAKGKTKKLKFKANITTGFRWTGFVLGGDSAVIESDEYISDPAPKNMCGVGGNHYFVLKAVQPGETIIRFQQARGPEEICSDQIYLVTVSDDLEIETRNVTEEGVLDAIVREVNEEEHSVTVREKRNGELIAQLAEDMALPVPGEHVKLYTNGTMTMSLPGMVNVIAWESVPSDEARADLPEDEAAWAAIDGFLANEVPVRFDYLADGSMTDVRFWEYDTVSEELTAGRDYSFTDFMAAYCRAVSNYYEGHAVPGVMEYAYLDCGCDGVLELALRFREFDLDATDVNEIFVFKLIEGELQCVFMSEYGYRTYGELSQSGLYRSGGSNSAFSSGASEKLISGSGDVRFHCDVDTYLSADGIAQMCGNYEFAEKAAELGIGENLQAESYTFAPYNGEDVERETLYTFIPTDEMFRPLEGEELAAAYAPGSPFMQLWESTGLKFSTSEEIKARSEAHAEEIGLTEEIRNAPEASWEAIPEEMKKLLSEAGEKAVS